MPSNYNISPTMHVCKYGLPQAGEADVTTRQPPRLHQTFFNIKVIVIAVRLRKAT